MQMPWKTRGFYLPTPFGAREYTLPCLHWKPPWEWGGEGDPEGPVSGLRRGGLPSPVRMSPWSSHSVSVSPWGWRKWFSFLCVRDALSQLWAHACPLWSRHGRLGWGHGAPMHPSRAPGLPSPRVAPLCSVSGIMGGILRRPVMGLGL